MVDTARQTAARRRADEIARYRELEARQAELRRLPGIAAEEGNSKNLLGRSPGTPGLSDAIRRTGNTVPEAEGNSFSRRLAESSRWGSNSGPEMARNNALRNQEVIPEQPGSTSRLARNSASRFAENVRTNQPLADMFVTRTAGLGPFAAIMGAGSAMRPSPLNAGEDEELRRGVPYALADGRVTRGANDLPEAGVSTQSSTPSSVTGRVTRGANDLPESTAPVSAPQSSNRQAQAPRSTAQRSAPRVAGFVINDGNDNHYLMTPLGGGQISNGPPVSFAPQRQEPTPAPQEAPRDRSIWTGRDTLAGSSDASHEYRKGGVVQKGRGKPAPAKKATPAKAKTPTKPVTKAAPKTATKSVAKRKK